MDYSVTSFYDYDYLMKIGIIGDSGVGKTALLSRYIENKFERNVRATLGVESKHKLYNYDNKLFSINFCDTAGQERFRAVSDMTLRGSNAVIIVYDIVNRKSFDNLEYWIEKVQDICEENIQILLIGNKKDLKAQRIIDKAKAKEFCEIYDISYFETSALSSEKVEEAFNYLIENCIKNQCYVQEDDIQLKEPKLDKQQHQQLEQKKCCGLF